MTSAPCVALRCRRVTSILYVLLTWVPGSLAALAQSDLPQRPSDARAPGDLVLQPDRRAEPVREDVELGSVVIEAEPILEPGIDELMRSFRDALEQDRQRRSLDIVERQYASGALEVDTRYGRFCFAPLPAFLGSDLTPGSALASRCAAF
jgi:hypothetical protein